MKTIIYIILMLFVTLALQAQYSKYDAYTVNEELDSAFSLQVNRYAYDTIKSKNKIQYNLFLKLGGNLLWRYC